MAAVQLEPWLQALINNNNNNNNKYVVMSRDQNAGQVTI
jgi:hypothetical protein